MAKPTDIRAAATELFFLPVETRVPLKFGPGTLTHVTCARARLTVRLGNGSTATGWGETPLSVQWVWPSALPYETRHQALKEFCVRLAKAWAAFDASGHSLELGHDFQQTELPKLLEAFNADSPAGEPMPWLAAPARLLLALRHRAARRAWPSAWPADLRDVHARVPQPRPWPIPRAGQRLGCQLRRAVPERVSRR